MNKKILAIGSIIACIIILLASLSPVVGYNSARSSVKDSPLFSVRAKRAIDKESKDALTFNYMGKGKGINLLIPKWDNQTAQIQKFIDRISRMDDKSFNNFVAQIVRHLQYQKEFTDIETSEVIQTLHYMRANPVVTKHVAIQEAIRDDADDYTDDPGCRIVWLIIVFLLYLYFLYCEIITYYLSFRVTSCLPLCLASY